jgi:hypothetical protein
MFLRPARHGRWLAPAFACALCLTAGERPARAADITEAQARAAFFINFTHFVEWPSRPAGPLVLCIAGDASLLEAVTTLVHGRPAGSQEMHARDLKVGEIADGCHALYVGFERASDRADLMQQVYGPILTVGDSELFLRQGGIIRLFVEETRMRFQIDQKNADAAGLRLSAQLLGLAER